ncbi:hypothetical protein RhiirA4_460118 [Rhizophagus irregularis]|uniref:Uncharacterized protein n=1 Tax=Rhizophagus irregularis TaxID=588596 RepID=A0A2I1GFW1_9GLOM|nr:hypothetical protein RhiirA4_460118 [Rhizophagus irregularis]
MDQMNAINASIVNDDLGNGLWIKKQYDYIDNGDLQECIRRTSYQNIASSSSAWCSDGVATNAYSLSLVLLVRSGYTLSCLVAGENPYENYENAFAVEIDTMKLVSFSRTLLRRTKSLFSITLLPKNSNKGKLCAKHKQQQPEMIDIFYNDYKILFMIVNFNTNGL